MKRMKVVWHTHTTDIDADQVVVVVFSCECHSTTLKTNSAVAFAHIRNVTLK